MGSEAEYQRTDEDVLRDLPFKLAPRVTKAGTRSVGGTDDSDSVCLPD